VEIATIVLIGCFLLLAAGVATGRREWSRQPAAISPTRGAATARSPATRGRLARLRWRALLGALLLAIGLASSLAAVARSQERTGTVYIAQIHGEIDLGLAPYLARVLDEAQRANASAVVLDINTPGGRLDAALQMRQALLDSPIRTIAFVNREAFSAGALIAISANEIYMAPGSVLGAATPVTASGETAPPKAISAVRSVFRSTAEVRGRDPRIAEAMVDPGVAIDGLVESGKLLTLTANDARARGYADGVVANRQALLQTAGLSELAVQEAGPALAEHLVRIITNPVVASLMMTVGLLLVLADLFAGGGGVAAAVGTGIMALFFWGHMLAGLAGWEGVALVGLGLVLLGLEAFVIPGFGVAGILGIVSFGAGLFISLIGGEIVTDADLIRAAWTVGLTLTALLVGGVGLLWLLSRTGVGGGLFLQARLGAVGGRPPQAGVAVADADVAHASATIRPSGSVPPSLTGARGVALSDLRPGGFALIDGARVDVVTEGDYLPAGTGIEIIMDEGYRRVVRRFEGAQGASGRIATTSRT
jgi:membrane-bound serine protease (ClpP class)